MTNEELTAKNVSDIFKMAIEIAKREHGDAVTVGDVMALVSKMLISEWGKA